MYFIYSLLLTIGFVVLLPRFAIDALRSRKYVTGLGQRLGSLPKLNCSERAVIWLHCVSVGETEAARPLVRALRKRFPDHLLVISTTTVTGQQVARRAFAADAAAIFYFPIDWAWVVRRVLRRLRPAVVLIMETELWPNLLRQCRRRSIPVALINGRISQTSFSRYRLIRRFMRRVLNDLSIASMQSEEDASRVRRLGLAADHVLMGGNLKFDSAAAGGDPAIASLLHDRFGFNENQQLIVAASTHSPEEEIVLDAFKQIKRSERDQMIRLLIAPRHPERFDEVAALLKKSGLSWARRSASPDEHDAACDVVLLDSIGELRDALSLADTAFIGGSIAPHGGHNLLEPAAQGVCVVTGAHTQNFAAITTALLAADALVQLPQVSFADASSELATTLRDLLRNDSRRREIGQRALHVCERNRGATDRAISVVVDLLEARGSVGAPLPLPAVRLPATK